MVAGIVLTALGVKKTLGHVADPLEIVAAAALLGGIALYLIGHLGFRWRQIHTLSPPRLLATVAILALLPAALELPALATLAIAAAVLTALIVYEVVAYAEFRDRLRHQVAEEPAAAVR